MRKVIVSGNFYQMDTRYIVARKLSQFNHALNHRIYKTENHHRPIQPNNLVNKPYTLLRTKSYPPAQIFPLLLNKQKLTFVMNLGNPLSSGEHKCYLTYSPSQACRFNQLSVQVINRSLSNRQNQTTGQNSALIFP